MQTIVSGAWSLQPALFSTSWEPRKRDVWASVFGGGGGGAEDTLRDDHPIVISRKQRLCAFPAYEPLWGSYHLFLRF